MTHVSTSSIFCCIEYLKLLALQVANQPAKQWASERVSAARQHVSYAAGEDMLSAVSDADRIWPDPF